MYVYIISYINLIIYFYSMRMLIANATAPLNGPLYYPRELPAELVAELPRRKQDAIAISSTCYLFWPANISEAILQVNAHLPSWRFSTLK
jgi:hypothetical protein